MFMPTDILSIESWVLIGTVFGLIWYYFHRKWQYLTKLNIPHEPPSLMQMGSIKKMFEEAFTIDNEMKQKFGPIWGFYFMTTPSLVIHDIDVLRQIYIKDFPSFPTRQDRLLKIFGKELGCGLTVVVGDQWKRLRSTVSPTFSTAKIREMIPIIGWCADNASTSLERKNKDGDGTFNAKELFSRLSLDIICSAAFSRKVDSQDDTKEDPEIVVQAKKIFAAPFASPLLIISFVFPAVETLLTKLGVCLIPKSSLDYFRSLVNYIIDERQKNKDEEHRVDLLQLMLDSEISEEEAENGEKKGMTRLEILGNSILMILAGYENTANTMGFLAYNMAQHPEIQAQVQEEIDEMVETYGKFSYEGINNMKLLDMCFNESLRLYHPLPRNARICTKETIINGITIPKGMGVAIPSTALAHDPEYWDEPYEFRPERMRDMSDIDPMMFQPFGAGPRNCVGLRFAQMEVKMGIIKLLHKFTFKPSDNTPKPPLKLKFGTSVRPAVDFNLRAVPR